MYPRLVNPPAGCAISENDDKTHHDAHGRDPRASPSGLIAGGGGAPWVVVVVVSVVGGGGGDQVEREKQIRGGERERGAGRGRLNSPRGGGCDG